mmetsp:Transcript_23500/g.34817  ORF Transcript_23500/g.34817 Transcript_23500/m.34817 type:complete len:301 (-) Transcript_23500:229-1131(-)
MRVIQSLPLAALLTFLFEAISVTASTYHFHPSAQKPISLRSGIVKAIATKWQNANNLAVLEQAVEDYNAEEIVASATDAASAVSYRRLIVLPLDERFDPPAGVFSHGHVQTGDKMSLPREFWTAIQKSNAEVPWLFEVSRVDGVTGPRAVLPPSMEDPNLNRVVGGAIDFRSPPNYVFLPRWMMQALALKPRDVVDVKLIQTVPAGSAVKLRPHSSEFVNIANHQAVLETELKHYSALVRGSTIPFDYNGKRFYFDVVDLRSSPRGEKVPIAKVQDCDIAAEFIRAKDQMKKKKAVDNKD